MEHLAAARSTPLVEFKANPIPKHIFSPPSEEEKEARALIRKERARALLETSVMPESMQVQNVLFFL